MRMKYNVSWREGRLDFNEDEDNFSDNKKKHEDTISLIFTGDVVPIKNLEHIFISNPKKVFGNTLKVLKNASLRIFNLESVLTDWVKKKQKTVQILKLIQK